MLSIRDAVVYRGVRYGQTMRYVGTYSTAYLIQTVYLSELYFRSHVDPHCQIYHFKGHEVTIHGIIHVAL